MVEYWFQTPVKASETRHKKLLRKGLKKLENLMLIKKGLLSRIHCGMQCEEWIHFYIQKISQEKGRPSFITLFSGHLGGSDS